MKTAILISGQLRTLDVCSASIVRHVLKHFPGAHLFAHFERDKDAEKSAIFQKWPVEIRHCASHERTELVEATECGTPLEQLGAVTGPGQYLLSCRPQNVLQQLFGLYMSYVHAGPGYDCYVRLRTDQYFILPCSGLPVMRPHVAVVPFWGGFGGYNDRFAVLGRLAAYAYFHQWTALHSNLRSGCRFHAETLLKHQLDKHDLEVSFTQAMASTLRETAPGEIEHRLPEILPHEGELAFHAKPR